MTKKVLMTLALVAMLLPVVAGVALAGGLLIQCKSVPCIASGDKDKVLERKGNGKNDRIIMKGGNDLVEANRYTNDRDVVRGGPGNDLINVADGDTRDKAAGGAGTNHCIVDSRSEAGKGCYVTVR